MNPATTPQIQYTHAEWAEYTIRPTALISPNVLYLHYNFGSSGEIIGSAYPEWVHHNACSSGDISHLHVSMYSCRYP